MRNLRFFATQALAAPVLLILLAACQPGAITPEVGGETAKTQEPVAPRPKSEDCRKARNCSEALRNLTTADFRTVVQSVSDEVAQLQLGEEMALGNQAFAGALTIHALNQVLPKLELTDELITSERFLSLVSALFPEGRWLESRAKSPAFVASLHSIVTKE